MEKADKQYDLIIVGAGLFGATIAFRAKQQSKKVLVLDRRNHIAGNVYTENQDGINVHKYGAHIFHTDYEDVWEFVNQFATFNRYTNSPVARYKDELYNLPFNMNTFSKIWPDVFTPEDAKRHIDEERKEMEGKTPSNLEEQAISLVGRSIYEKLIKNYTEKQWHRDCKDLPAEIIKRLPVRFIYDNNYFNDKYQGIPIGGYTQLVEKMLDGIEVRLNTDYLQNRDEYRKMASKIVYSGMIDEYFDYKLGKLEYRSLRFETEKKETPNYQGNAVVNYTGDEVAYTRVIEHKHFEHILDPESIPTTIVTYEYPDDWDAPEKEAFYTINDDRNNKLAEEYRELAAKEDGVIFGGRLADYRYYDMDDVIKKALETPLE